MPLMFLLLIPSSIVPFIYKTPPIWIAISVLVLYIGTIFSLSKILSPHNHKVAVGLYHLNYKLSHINGVK